MRFSQHLLTMVVVAFPVAANAQHVVGRGGNAGGMQQPQVMHQQRAMHQQMLYEQHMMRQHMVHEQQMMHQQMIYEQQMMQQAQQRRQARRSSAARSKRNRMSSSAGGNQGGPGQAPSPNGSIASINTQQPVGANQPFVVQPTPSNLPGAINQPFFSSQFQEAAGTVGGSHVRVVNPTGNTAEVELRPQGLGDQSAFRVPARGSEEVTVANGSYQVFFRFSNEPGARYQGDDIGLSNQVAEIRLEATTNGNYGLRRVN
jgi:hypothetical protein